MRLEQFAKITKLKANFFKLSHQRVAFVSATVPWEAAINTDDVKHTELNWISLNVSF